MHQEIDALFNLHGKVAMITGGAQNLGLDMSCILAAAGADIILTSRRQQKAAETGLEITRRYGVNALGLPLDQTDAEQVQAVIGQAATWQGHIDVFINNAGGGGTTGATRLLERQPADVDLLLRTNLNGMLYCSAQIARVMVRQASGKIINVASIAGIVGRDRRLYDKCGMQGQSVDYAASKAGIIGATRDMAAYLGPMGVTVNCVSPGGFSGRPGRVSDEFAREYSQHTPLSRMGRDERDIKGVILFLASPASDYMTGANLVIDGGFSIWN